MKKFFDKKEANKIDHSVQIETTNYIKNKDKHKCFCRNCNNDAVRSHAISKKSSLKNIVDDNNKVLSFIKGKLYSTESGLRVSQSDEPFGINEATTFKGFCTEHEKLFTDIDVNGIETRRDLVYQIYRNVAYAYWKEKFQKNLSEKKFELIREKINNREFIKNFYDDYDSIKNLNDESLKNIIDGIIENYKEKDFTRMNILKNLMENLEILVSKLNYDTKLPNYDTKLPNYEIGKLENVQLTVFFKRIDVQIPLAMLNDFGYILSDKTISNLFFSVIPYKDSTDIIMVVDEKCKDNAYDFWVNNTQDDLSTLNLIESMMIKSEFWFIKPDIINLMNIEKKNCLALDIRYGTNEHALDFEYKYDMSIFDDLRLELIETNNYDKNIKEKEMLKIDNIPGRESQEVRESKLSKAIYSQVGF